MTARICKYCRYSLRPHNDRTGKLGWYCDALKKNLASGDYNECQGRRFEREPGIDG